MNSCTKCKWYEPGDNCYGEYVGTSYPAACLKRPNIANLKGFPYQNQLNCFEPDLPKAIVPTE